MKIQNIEDTILKCKQDNLYLINLLYQVIYRELAKNMKVHFGINTINKNDGISKYFPYTKRRKRMSILAKEMDIDFPSLAHTKSSLLMLFLYLISPIIIYLVLIFFDDSFIALIGLGPYLLLILYFPVIMLAPFIPFLLLPNKFRHIKNIDDLIHMVIVLNKNEYCESDFKLLREKLSNDIPI